MEFSQDGGDPVEGHGSAGVTTSVPAGPGRPAVGAATGGLVLPGDVVAVGRYLTAAKAESTRKAYDADFRAWSTWARRRGFAPLPAADAAVATYLAALGDAGASPRTIARRLSGIGHAHREAGYRARPSTRARGRCSEASGGPRPATAVVLGRLGHSTPRRSGRWSRTSRPGWPACVTGPSSSSPSPWVSGPRTSAGWMWAT